MRLYVAKQAESLGIEPSSAFDFLDTKNKRLPLVFVVGPVTVGGQNVKEITRISEILKSSEPKQTLLVQSGMCFVRI